MIEIRPARGEGSLSPATFLTKICMFSSGSADEAREEVEEKLLERMIAVLANSGA